MGRAQARPLPSGCTPQGACGTVEGMKLPTLGPIAAIVLGEDMTFTLGFGLLVAGGIVTWAETRFHVSGLRETVKTQGAEIASLQTRLAAAEVREGRTVERLDYVTQRLDRIDNKLDRLLDAYSQRMPPGVA